MFFDGTMDWLTCRRKVSSFNVRHSLSYISSVDGNFLLFAKKQEIRGVYLDDADLNSIPALTVPFVYSPLAMDYDVDSRRFFWIQEAETSLVSGVSSANLNGTNVEVVVNSGGWRHDSPIYPGGFSAAFCDIMIFRGLM